MAMGSDMPWQINLSDKDDIIWYHFDITLISPPVVLAATALPRITSRLTKRIHMLHACYILHLWYFDVFGVFCIILGASVTFCHPPLGFCWEQRAFRLCTRQSSKLLFVFLRWGKETTTMQQTKSNKKCTSWCLARPNRSNRSLNWRSLYCITFQS